MSSPAAAPIKKPFGKSDGWRRVKLAFKRLIGREPWITNDIIAPLQRFGDWWLCRDLVREGQMIYSLGVGQDIGFDLALIQALDVQVFAFDPTPSSITWLQAQQLPPQFHFFPWAVADRDGSLFLYPRVRSDGSQSKMMHTILATLETRDDGIEVPVKSLKGIRLSLGHEHVDILKIDIEGTEYAVLRDMLNSSLRPAQLLVEFHHRFPGLSVVDTVQAVGSLRQAGYGLARISSSGREYTFILKSCLIQIGRAHV